MVDVIISCALTGAGDTTGKSPAVPVSPRQIADQAVDAALAGAAIVHIHVRDPETGAASRELKLYRETVERVRDRAPDVILNLTTGPGARFVPDPDDPLRGAPGSTLATPKDRMEHVLELSPEICSLDIATFNFGENGFINVPRDIRAMAAMAREAGVKPEIEVFDLGHMRLAAKLHEDGAFDEPPLFQLCLGVPWAAPSTMLALAAMLEGLPESANWSAFALGSRQLPILTLVAMLGGNVRVGLEDNLYLRKDVLAPDNAALVCAARTILDTAGYSLANPKTARAKLGLN